MASYTITSDRLDSPKAEGDSITDTELLEMGANIEALIEGGHLSDGTAPKSAPKVADLVPATAPAETLGA
jgi:hypothetical protein